MNEIWPEGPYNFPDETNMQIKLRHKWVVPRAEVGWGGGLGCRNVILRGVRGARHSSWTLLSTLPQGGWEGEEGGKMRSSWTEPPGAPGWQICLRELSCLSPAGLPNCPSFLQGYSEVQGWANTFHTLCLSIRKY